jgi:signal transduction histidine kinase
MAAAALPFTSVRDGAIGRRLTVFMALGFLALIAAGIAAAWVTSENQRHTRWVAHTYQVENLIVDARRLLEQGEATRRGFLMVPDDRRFLDAYSTVAGELAPQLRRLRRLVRDNPVQERWSARLNQRIAALTERRDQTIRLVEAGEVDAALAAFRADSEAGRMREIRGIFDAMAREERRLLALRDAELRLSEGWFYIVLGVAALLLAAVAATAWVTILSYTRDLAHSRDQLSQLNESLEEIVADRTSDLTRANDEIQRFAYIVSHDLRSPLVNVMGFTAELDAASERLRALIDRADDAAPGLVTEDERLAAREDLPEAIGFIRTSTQKMDRLINAILQLSRQGRRVLAPEPVDLVKLVDNLRSTLSHRLDEAEAVLETEGVLPRIVTDRFSIDQIISNLVDNAIKYLKPGVPGRIVVRGWQTGTRVTIDVADNGRGIAPSDHQRVFDLFRRSGPQDRPGEGIGLATVRALVFRLGGTIEVASTLGEGATFRLNLPATLDMQDRTE